MFVAVKSLLLILYIFSVATPRFKAAWRNGIASDYDFGNQEIAGSTPAVVICFCIRGKNPFDSLKAVASSLHLFSESRDQWAP